MSVTERALTWSAARLAGSSGELVRGLVAELSVVPEGVERRRWLRGGLWLVVREAGRMVARAAGHPGALVVGAVVVGLDGLGTSDDASQVTLAALLVGCALLGAARPAAAVPSAVAVGSAVAISQLAQLFAAAALGHGLATEAGSAGVMSAVGLFVLVLPALLAARLGVAARRRCARRAPAA